MVLLGGPWAPPGEPWDASWVHKGRQREPPDTPKTPKSTPKRPPRPKGTPTWVGNHFRHDFRMIFHRFGYRNRGANRARLSRKTFVESIVDQYAEKAFHSIKTEVPAMSAKKQVRKESAEDHRKNLRKRLRKTIREQLFDEAVSEPISVPKSMKNRLRIAPESTFSTKLGRLGPPRARFSPPGVDLPRSRRLGRAQQARQGSPRAVL